MKDNIKKKTKKIIPYILIGILSISAVLFSYDKGNEVQAAVVVDDIMVVTAILALCGVSFLGTKELWGDGNGWYPGIDAGQDIDEWIDDFNKPWKEEWDEKTYQYALEHGLIDKNGNYTGGGDNGSDDGDHKFPSWEKIKTLVKANGGNVATALGAYLPLLTGFAQNVLYDSGATLADKLIDDGVSVDSEYITASSCAVAYSPKEVYPSTDGTFCVANTSVLYSNTPICAYKRSSSPGGYSFVYVDYKKSSDNGYTLFFNKTGKSVGKYSHSGPGGLVLDIEKYSDYQVVNEDFDGSKWSKVYPLCPVFDSASDAKKYIKKQIGNTSMREYINPTSIGLGSAVKDGDQTGVDGIPVLPTLPINDFVKLPTADDLKDFFKKIGNDNDDKDKKQKDIDDFIKKLTTNDSSSGETPDPEPDPGGGGSGGGGGGTTTDTPDKDDNDDDGEQAKKDYARDLQKIFPFCIPFDIIDCFRLFNAEPETPRVEFPIHFGIVEKDYTFVIDLKDFDNVALLLRSTLLILFIGGLGFATRNVIKW